MSQTVRVSPLTAHLGYWLRFVSNHVSHAFARKLEGEGVTVAEWAMLRELYGVEPLGPSRLSEIMGLTRGGVSKLADRLIKKKLVCREDHPDDARAHRLSLTPAGCALIPTLAMLADVNEAEFFGHLDAGERAAVEELLKSIVEKRALKAIPLS